ncbi:hypothetical protein ACFVJK_37310 [Streptomyces sp. NPDC127172]|uniref:hypothetical protein n=1 Tax=Streptomyces sp. NPDC127172 TaxID=3345382 RepID=UPI00362698DC
MPTGRTGTAAPVPALPTHPHRRRPHRIDDLRAIAGEHPAIAALARDVPLGAAVLEDLEAHAVHTPVWHALTTDTTPRTRTQL